MKSDAVLIENLLRIQNIDFIMCGMSGEEVITEVKAADAAKRAAKK